MKGCTVQQQGLDSMVLVGPTQLKTCCDSVTERAKQRCKKKKRKSICFPDSLADADMEGITAWLVPALWVEQWGAGGSLL